MRTLTKFGIVLVVLAMVTSNAFANEYQGPTSDDSWCTAANWSTGDVPDCGDGDKVRIDDDDAYVIIDCTPAEAREVQIRNGTLQVGTTIANGDPADVFVDFTICIDLEMSDGSGSNYSRLNIVSGDVTVEGESKDVGKKGNADIAIADGSSLTFEDGVRIGTRNSDGCNNVHTLDIAGDFANTGRRFRLEGGTLTINLTGVGTFYTNQTTRLSRYKDSMTIVNISDDAAFLHDKDIEMGSDQSGQDCGASLEINISDNGTWDGSNKGKDLEFKKDGQICNVDITDDGSLIVKNCGERSDAELNLTVDGNGQFEVTEDLDVGQGSISITGNGGFVVGRRFDLGIDGVADMTVATTGNVSIGERLRIGKEGDDAELTIDGCRMNVDEEIQIGDNGSIDILGAGQLVIAGADDLEDWDLYAAMIDDGLIMTSAEGMVVVWDYGITHSGKFTMRIAKPVTIDIEPGTCPNWLRVNFTGQGVYPVAILGSEDFDVLNVDVATITLQGVAPLRNSYEDVSTFGGELCECATLGPDGFLDLTLKFDRQSILTALEESLGDLSVIPNRTDVRLTLFALLMDEDKLLAGKDCLRILNRGLTKPKK